ncbi:serine/threonine kinase 16 [Exophiala viscosa]|uniref:serine/threonine kinase 16 n=1 Tax=Exophiala viscosa TaxID=2486360 RepID=UPI0021A1F87D|nr:serine/threonine kinase 16 [Exophiala viscosa]
MGLGILEPRVEHVPGTVYVFETEQRHAELLEINQHLKTDNNGRTILIPQPSDDPNDPLAIPQNWPLWQRDLILAILCFVSCLATTASPLLAADSVTIALVFKRTFQDAALLTAYHLVGVCVAGWLFVASARVWGKRHLFLLGALLMVASSAWGGSTHVHHNYASLLWSRIFQGVALAPFEALVNACVGDLYFVHERGVRMAITNTCLFGGAFLTPVFVGMISAHLGWQWSFYLLAIFMAAGFLLVLFFVPETAYRRAHSLDLDLVAGDSSTDSLPNAQNTGKRDAEEKPPHATVVAQNPTRRVSYLQRLMPFNGRKTDESFFKLLFRPFPLFLHPAVAWACLIQGVIIGWTVMVGVILSLIFLGPPLFFNEERAGKMYTSAFIGSMLGLVLAGLYSEGVTRFMIRQHKGKYEPEFRILLVIPTLVFSAIGLYGFGITAVNVTRYGWLIPEVFLAFIIISMVMGAIASAQYLLDAHRELAVEAFTTLLIFKNIFSFVLAYNAYNWVFAIRINHLFIIFGSIEVAICLLSIPMYVFGKKNREFFHRHDILRMTGLR